MVMKLESPAFEHGREIPSLYTCEGRDISPPLKWSGVPEGATNLALIVDDPDAPDPATPKRTWVHWVLYDIPVGVSGLAENIRTLPTGIREGLNDWKRTGYGGPCPPIGRHPYFFKLYALDAMPYINGKASKTELEQAMQGHILAQATLMGTYQRGSK